MFENLRHDLARSLELNTDAGEPRWLRALRLPFHFGTQAVVVHRFGRWAAGIPVPVLRELLVIVHAMAKCLVQLASGICIADRTHIGKGFVVHTGLGVLVGPRRMGDNCYVQHGVVIPHAVREVGDNVYFGPGAKVHGGVRIGSNVDIGANAVVAQDVPDNCTALGNPARIIPKALYKMMGPAGPARRGDGRGAASAAP